MGRFRLLQIPYFDGYPRTHGLVEFDSGASVQIAPYGMPDGPRYIARQFNDECKHVRSAHRVTMWGALAAIKAVA